MTNSMIKRQSSIDKASSISERDRSRSRSIDVIRGIVMVLMALDHTRIFFCSVGLAPVSDIDPALFFTRWVTNYCAPAFFFLAGTSAYLRMTSGRSRRSVAKFLLIRGFWLILLEFTIVRLSWTFNVDYHSYNLAGVIWALGCSMLLLSGLVLTPTWISATVGIGLIGLHNIVPILLPNPTDILNSSPLSAILRVLYFGGSFTLGEEGPRVRVLYTLVPWFGVMAAGYAFGAIVRMKPNRQARWCMGIGLSAIVAFLVLRSMSLYGEPKAWVKSSDTLRCVMSFLDTSKYPASFQFLLMTLGPTIALIPLLDRTDTALTRMFDIFGRTPFLFYVLHIPLIHSGIALVCLIRTGELSEWLFANHPLSAPPPPPEIGFNVPVVWLVAAIVTGILYFPCRAMARLKARSRSAWLSYL